MIADTEFLISLVQGDRDAVAKAEELEAANEPIKIPAMAVAELYVGVGAELTEDEERQVTSVVGAHPIVEIDATIAMRAGRRIGKRGTKRFEKNRGDAIVGATAEVEGEAVLTRNVEDFEALGFDVEPY
jgi:predicted nucleic acid-binding protein